MKNVYGKDIKDNTRLTRHYQDWEVEMAKPNKDYITTNYFCPRRDITYDDCLIKLGALEDIEEKLGNNLYYIMKAMINGYYWRGIDGSIYHFPELDFIRKDTFDESPCRLNHYYWNHTGKYLEDYGKTWALTREEL